MWSRIPTNFLKGYWKTATNLSGKKPEPTWQEWYSDDYMKHPPWKPMLNLEALTLSATIRIQREQYQKGVINIMKKHHEPKRVSCLLVSALLLFGARALQAASTILLTSTTYTVTEGTGAVTLTVQRLDDIDTVVSADYASANGTATAGLQYTAVSGTLTFEAGETNKDLEVPILNDAIVGGVTSFLVTLSNPTAGAILGARTTATVRITDNDTGLSFESADYWAREDEGSVLIGVVRGDDGDFPLTVDVSTTDDVAQAGLDYTGLTNTLTFAAGETIKLLTVPILNDGLREAYERFDLTLSNASGGGVLGTTKTATVTILDNDPGVQLEFSTYWVQENEDVLSVRVLRGNDVELGAFTVEYATSDATALAGQDYAATQGTLEFAAGEWEKVLTVRMNPDETFEADEKFRINLNLPTGSASLGRLARAWVTILDATGLMPHRFDDLKFDPNRGVQLALGGGVHQRFRDYFDLYPIEVSSDLLSWSPLATLQRTNAATNALICTDPEAATSDLRFYRTVAAPLITPLQQPSGPFAVSVLSRLLTDPTRRNRYRVSTNGSFMISIWYPAIAESGQRPGPLEDEAFARDSAYWMNGVSFDRRHHFTSHAFSGAPCARNHAPCPVVLCSHGSTLVRTMIPGAENLASHGYVVVSVDHSDAYGTVFPDGTYLHAAPDTSTMSEAGFQDRLKDIRLVLAELPRWTASDPVLAGLLDLSRVATMGHSWGGMVAGEIGRVDDRVKAVVFLDPGGPGGDDLIREGLTKPFLAMYSTQSGGGSNTSLYTHEATTSAVWFIISPSLHNQFHDYHWLAHPSDLAGGREVLRTVKDYTLWFLNKHLKGLEEPVPAKADYSRVTNFRQK